MELKISNISHLLNLVRVCDDNRRKIKKVYEDNGLCFNIFDILQLTSSEVRLHSSILASLLRPEIHGAKSEFLKEFLRIPKIEKRSIKLDCSKTKVEVEKYIGPLSETTGGRIDLYVSDGNSHLIIENKIYAGDQKNQLLRYHNFKPDAVMIYLTLFGSEPSKESLGGLNTDRIICLSYKDDIIPWLSKCVQLAANLPYVRETINQYINTLSQLTNSYMTQNNDIIELIKKPDNIGAAISVWINLESAINQIMNDFLDSLKNELPDGFTCLTEKQTDWLRTRWYGFRFEYKDWKDFDLKFEFEGTYLSGLYIGIVRKSTCTKDIRSIDEAIKLAKHLNFTIPNDKWFWDYPTEPKYSNWLNDESIQMLLDGSMKDWIIGILRSAM